MIITHKTECFPNEEQRQIIERNFGMRRFYFNKSIMYLKHKYGDLKENRKSIKNKEILDLKKDLFSLKYKDLMKTAPRVILDSAIDDVQFALTSLFRKGKEINLRKKKVSNTFRIFRKNEVSFRYENNSKYITTIRLKNLKMAEPLRWSINASEGIKTITIKRNANRYFISISMEVPDNQPQSRTNKHLGLDWGLKTYLTGFDGNEMITADFDEAILKRLDARINLYQKQLSRKVINSKRYWKATTKLQQAYLDFNNYRHDEIKKIVCYINQTYDTVSIEKLNMKFAIKNKHLSKRVHQKPYYLFKETLVNKFNQFNKDVYYVPKDYPSTQICSNCGNRKMDDDKVKLGESVYKCSKCGTVIDRDENAARNIYTYKNLEKVILN